MLCIFTIASGLVACSEDNRSGNYVDSLTFEIEENARRAFNKTTNACEDPEDCPNYIGSLVTFSKETENYTESYTVNFCSQQLVGHNLVLTNKHCVPEDIAYEGADCYGRIQAKFPETKDYSSEALNCSKVIKITQNYAGTFVDRPDWALLELRKSSQRPAPQTLATGIPFGTSVTVYPTYFTSQEETLEEGQSLRYAHGLIRKASCRSTRRHFFSGRYIHPKSSIATIVCDNDIVPGNSGSGFYDKDQNLIGIGSFALFSPNGKVSYFGKEHTVKARLFGGTNLHCISHFNSNPSPFCKVVDNDKMAAFSRSVPLLVGVAEASADQQDLIEYDNRIGWESGFRNFYEKMEETEAIKKFYEAVPKFLVDHVADYVHKTAGTKVPTCIHPSAPDAFTADSPLREADPSKAKLNIFGEISVDVKTVGFRFNFKRTELDSNLYNFRFTRMESPAREKFMEMNESVAKLKKQCTDARKDFNFLDSLMYCAQYKVEKMNQDKWLTDNNIDPAIIKNEMALLGGMSDEGNLTLPVCNEEQVSELF